MHRVTAGSPIAFTFTNVSAPQGYTARVTDALGRFMTASVTSAGAASGYDFSSTAITWDSDAQTFDGAEGADVVVSVPASEWRGTRGGWGRVEIARGDDVVSRSIFRIAPGIDEVTRNSARR